MTGTACVGNLMAKAIVRGSERRDDRRRLRGEEAFIVSGPPCPAADLADCYRDDVADIDGKPVNPVRNIGIVGVKERNLNIVTIRIRAADRTLPDRQRV